jgi:hypothetical protein
MSAKPIDVTVQTVDQLENIIRNHRREGATDRPLYLQALEEFERRKGQGLDFAKSRSAILAAATERRFLSYKELADASDVDWQRVHYSVGNHLWRLVEYAHRCGWPMLSAIVVNQQNRDTGKMEPDTLRGFINAARLLGYSIVDEETFLREQQALVFEWAANQPGDEE